MAEYIEIYDFNTPELDIFARLTGAQLRAAAEAKSGIFIAESPTVIDVAINAGCEPLAFLTDKRLLSGSCGSQLSRYAEIFPNAKFYIAERELMRSLTGFELTRGALCAMKRPSERHYTDLIKDAKRIAILESITDSTNIGALFRSAAALGIDAVLTTPSCCDPLCRRAVRVSMGNVLLVPFAKIGATEEDFRERELPRLKDFGFKSCAMALTDNSIGLDSEELQGEERLAIILGTEGTGLNPRTILLSDYTVKIPMERGVDSLNVAAAGAIAFYEITRGVRKLKNG